MKLRALIIGVAFGFSLLITMWGLSADQDQNTQEENPSKKVEILEMKYKVQETEYLAKPATLDEVKQAGLTSSTCSCGQALCFGEWVMRCMAGGGGPCVWYPTNEVCQ